MGMEIPEQLKDGGCPRTRGAKSSSATPVVMTVVATCWRALLPAR